MRLWNELLERLYAMTTPTASKYQPPLIPEIVDRERLVWRLKESQRPVLIVAQAAQGKSTLAASYVGNSGVPAAWMHLEEAESEAANFYYLMVHSLQHAFERRDLSEFLKNPPIALGPRTDISRCLEKLLHLLATLPSPLDLVFDGLENLAPESQALALIESLLASAPPGNRIFLLSREMPSFRMQRQKINRELLILSNDDLAFTPEEIHAFFLQREEMALLPEQVARIRTITEGWAGGLVLLTEGLKKVPKQDRDSWFDAHLPELVRGELLRYFSEEIFAAQPEPVRKLLIISSVLDVIDPQILSRLCEIPGTQEILQEMVQRNLFIQPFQDRDKGALYRYNRLFRDFLHSLFEQELSDRRKRKLLKRAGDLFWEAELYEIAIGYFLKAGDTDRAADGILKIALDLVIRGRSGDLARWIEALPPEKVLSDPWLIFYRALTHRISGGKRTLADLETALKGFRKKKSVRGQMLSLAYLIEAAVFLGGDPADLQGWMREGESLLGRWSAKPLYAYAKAALWLQIGFGHIAGAGDLQKGISACQNAYLLALRIRETTLQVNATIVSVLGLAAAGDFLEADQTLERIGKSLAETQAYPEYRVLQSIVDIQLAMNRGDFDHATQALELSRRDIETFGLLFLYPAFIDTCGLLSLYRGDLAEAEHQSRHLSDVAVLAGSAHYGALSLRLRGMIQYFKGNFEKAFQLASQAAEKLPETPGANIHRVRLLQLLGMTSMHLGDLEAAESHLQSAMAQSTGASSHLSPAEIHLGLGLVYHGKGNHPLAQKHLHAGFRTAAEKGYVHFLVMRPADVARACLLEAGSGSPEKDYASGLLSGRFAQVQDTEIDALLGEDAKDEGKNSVEVRRALHRSRLPRLHIVTLGGFSVLRDGKEPIEERQWTGNRPKLLLKSIVVHGGQDIPKDILIEDLWPESTGEAAAKSFKVTLHRLRKILEPGLHRELGSSYLHLKDNLVSLDRELCRIDVEEFLALVKEIRKMEDRASSHEVLDRCTRAAALYGGDFFPEELYAPWAEMKRTVLRDHYLEVLTKMADNYSEQTLFDQAADCFKRILRVDPTSDSTCRNLMRLYCRQGMRNAALKAYEDFKSLLESDIGVDPDPETFALYRQIQKG